MMVAPYEFVHYSREMKKVLVLGGTRYFGRNLVEDLLSKGHDVVIATRGNDSTPFSKPVHFVKADRKNADDLKSLTQWGPFDIIFDQICYTALDAHISTEAFKNHCKKYIFTSTGSVYDMKSDHALIESDFLPENYPIHLNSTHPSYQEGKRGAEAVFISQKYFPVVMVRFPIVLGENDYTERLNFHVFKIANEIEFSLPRLETKFVFISAEEAGQFLSYMSEQNFKGPINAASNGVIKLSQLIEMIESATGKKAKIVPHATALNSSPFGSEIDFILDTGKARSLGFKFANLFDYLPKLINSSL